MVAYPTIIGGGRENTQTGGVFFQPTGILTNGIGANENNAKVVARQAGVFSRAAAGVNNSGVARVFMFRKNNADTSLSPSITDNTQGIFQDNSNTVTVAVNDTFDINYRQTSGSNNSYAYFVRFLGNTATAGYWGTAQASVAVATWYLSWLGGSTNSSSVAAVPVRSAGTASYFSVVVTTSAANAGTCNFRKNGANGNQTISYTGGTTGRFTDTTNTDSFVSGDTLGAQWNNTSTTGNIGVNCYVEYSGNDSEVSLPGMTFASGVQPAATAKFQGLVGVTFTSADWLTSENVYQYVPGFAFRLLKWRMNITTSTTSATATFKVRKNGANANGTLTVGAAATGQFEDTTNVDTFTSTDNVNVSVTGSGTGGILIGGHAILLSPIVANTQPVTVTCVSTVTPTKKVGKLIAAVCATLVTLSPIKQLVKLINVTSATTTTVTAQRAFLKSIAITCASAVTLFKSVQKQITVTCASTVTMLRSAVKPITVTCASAVTMLKQAGKRITVTCVSAVTMARAMSKLVTITCTSLVAMTKRTGKNIAVACTSSVTIPKIVSHPIAITCASAVTMFRQAGKRITITCTSLVSFLKSIGHFVTITCISAVSLTKRTSKLILIVCTSLVTVTKRTSKFITALCTSSVVLFKTALQLIDVSCASAVTLIRSTSKRILITCSSLTTLAAVKLILITIPVACVSTVTRTKFVRKFINLAATSLTTMTRRTSHSFSLTAATTTIVTKRGLKTISASCVTLVTMGRSIGQVIRVFCEVQVIRVGKDITKTLNVLSVAVVTIFQRFILPVIRTPIFGRANSPMIALGEDRIARIGGRASTVQVHGKAQPEE